MSRVTGRPRAGFALLLALLAGSYALDAQEIGRASCRERV